MVQNHLAVILFFEGPLFYIGLWMALDLAVFAGVLGFLVRVFHPERTNISHGLRPRGRCAGVLLVLFAIAV